MRPRLDCHVVDDDDAELGGQVRERQVRRARGGGVAGGSRGGRILADFEVKLRGVETTAAALARLRH